MTEGFYFDTSIWLDFHEKRGKNGGSALKLILKILNEDLRIGYSDLNVKEFKDLDYTQDQIDSVLSMLKPNNIQKVHIYREQKEEAKKTAKQRNVPEGDALQAILCRDNNLQMISRDLHFMQLRDITIAKLPEDLI
ncbi:MAG TPA: PIN domain-containing protein [Candidatus Nanoarchaeia archaeon]|nr:PIN domain-containing protein [Candidatus Nanoarchaeia archaeon]